ncbi:hypothetical protein WMF30_45050 [Sorangium sp. So ce134]
MSRRLGAGGVLVVGAAVWIACAGETSVSVDDLEGRPCDARYDCATHLGLDCIRGACLCPTPGDRVCCLHDEEPCGRECRPASECAEAQDAGATPGDLMTCDTPEDCPKPVDTRCGVATCTDGVCGLDLVPEPEHQPRGDCIVLKCGPLGKIYKEVTLADAFNDGNECTVDSCNKAKKTTRTTPVERGPSPSSSGYCDGQGHWVACLRPEDCRNPALTCSKSGACVPTWCENGIFESLFGETAQDCGGECDPCPAGLPCATDADCKEHVCSDGMCARATCRDQVQNGSETGVDCGGASCDRCTAGQGCAQHNDCTSDVCSLGTCATPSCDDGVMNGDENAVDCGGSCPCGTDTEQDP